ncbi:MAG: DNA mismatch repair protein MutS, partial [Proteobacteria bacterium]
ADLERIAVRVELGACQPRELGAVRDACGCIPKVVKALEQHGCEGLKYLAALMKGIVINPQLNARLQAALSDDLPIYLGEQDTIRSGFDAELDRVRGLRSSGRAWIAEFEERQRSLSGIGSLKVKFNNVLGYFIEVTRPNLGKVPTHYIRRQSTVSCERFTTEELNKRELEVLGAEERERALEKGLFEELRLFVAAFTRELREVSAALGQLDALSSLAETAVRENFVEPEIDDSADLIIEQGKHAVLSKLLQDNFVPNSTQLLQDDKRCFVLTGPNMGGKSTYLRQIGLIVILAQIGSFVPARSARIGIVDKIFARIGASDNIAEGESTFLVEMREASNIVNCATERSLLLIDEIGRGTATADGLAIAQAVLEWAAKKGARTIFATHFHELTGLAHHLPQIGNLCVASAEDCRAICLSVPGRS